ncbi:MAG: tetratricopeptide repeat protein [Proteobacteria bacterium]|nr:tetratricopeptide repeat protein [Pseudomonadota bacterium]
MLTFKHMAILIISPTSGLYDMSAEHLNKMGFGLVLQASSAKEAMALMHQRPISLVITAWKMPAMSGLQLLQSMRRDKTYGEIPLIMVNDTQDEELFRMAIREGAQGYLILPLKTERLTQMVEEIMTSFVDPDQEQFFKYLESARKLHFEKDYAGAAAEYGKAVGISENPIALVAWGDMLLENDPSQAESMFQRALAVDPENVKALFGLAMTLKERQALGEAERTLEIALAETEKQKKMQKHAPHLHYYQGEIRLELKKLKEAAESFSQAIQADPQNAELQVKIGDAYAQRGYYQESEQYYTQAIKLDPHLIHVYNKIGIAYRKQGKLNVAIALYNKARQFAPDDENLLYNIARAHLEMNEFDQARQILTEALEINPRFREARALIQRLDARTSD